MSNETHNEQGSRKIGKIIAIVVAGIVMVALIVGGIRKKEPTPVAESQLPDGCKPGYLFSETTGTPCPQPSAPALETSSIKTTQTSYQETVNAYTGKMMVFGPNCTLGATVASTKVGTRMLFANDGGMPVTITVGDRVQKLEGNHYFTMVFKAKGTIPVQCNAMDIANISIQ